MKRTFLPRDLRALHATLSRRIRKTVALKVSLLSLGLLALVGCAASRAQFVNVPAPPEVVSSQARFRKEYLLTPGDEVEVVVWRVPEVSRTVTIRPDGYISLPVLNDVKAAGSTPGELSTRLGALFSTRLRSPEVTVIANQVRQQQVYVEGDVNTPVVVPLRNAATAMQAIAFAGGFKRSAANRDIAIIRLTDDGILQAIPVGVHVGGQPGPYMALQTTLLQADDIIFVPESGRSQFSRFIDDFITRPVGGINQLMGTYFNYKIVQIASRQ